MRKRARLALLELLLLTAGVGCKPAAKSEPNVAASATSRLQRALAPRAAGRFKCREGQCRQQQPRLPDTGEWRCAERAHVVWCAGGEPAAGVVSGRVDPGFRCGARWGHAPAERVCIDRHPDYPDETGDFDCSFEQERSIVRVCRANARIAAPLPAQERALPACWLDRDCPSGACDRGVCTCNADPQCQTGRCRAGVCAEGKP